MSLVVTVPTPSSETAAARWRFLWIVRALLLLAVAGLPLLAQGGGLQFGFGTQRAPAADPWPATNYRVLHLLYRSETPSADGLDTSWVMGGLLSSGEASYRIPSSPVFSGRDGSYRPNAAFVLGARFSGGDAVRFALGPELRVGTVSESSSWGDTGGGTESFRGRVWGVAELTFRIARGPKPLRAGLQAGFTAKGGPEPGRELLGILAWSF